MTLTADSILCLALHLSPRYPESVPLDNDWGNQAPLAFSEHVADGCVSCSIKSLYLMARQVPLSRYQERRGGGGGEGGVRAGKGIESSSSLFYRFHKNSGLLSE